MLCVFKIIFQLYFQNDGFGN